MVAYIEEQPRIFFLKTNVCATFNLESEESILPGFRMVSRWSSLPLIKLLREPQALSRQYEATSLPD